MLYFEEVFLVNLRRECSDFEKKAQNCILIIVIIQCSNQT